MAEDSVVRIYISVRSIWLCYILVGSGDVKMVYWSMNAEDRL